MSQPPGPDDRPPGPQPHGSSAYGGAALPNRPLPGQPSGEQHTEQLPPVWPGHAAQADTGPATVAGMPVAAPRPPADPHPATGPRPAVDPHPPTGPRPVVDARPAAGPRTPSFWDGDAADHHPDGTRAEQDRADRTRTDLGGPAWTPAAPAEATYGAPGAAASPTEAGVTAPDWSDRPVAVRRPDTIAGLLLLLAGIAAGVSLLVVWVHGGGTGFDLVRNGIDDARVGTGRLADTGTWQPLAVVLGGALLFLVGLFLFTPARTHRFLGGLGLVVTLLVAAGVLVPLADARWSFDRFTTGFWFAIAVAGLGVLGSLKALMTGPKVR
ncbi:hypothetical protein [Modestobacter sp. NPDC049651]|uniref:hypothetical protein n=1 Tax=unclassified Modestobacter TaxID=2643866 RepID=UPI0033F49EF1